MIEKPLPEPCYPCRGCGDIQTFPANMLWWSDSAEDWYCDECFVDDDLGEFGISLAEELERRGLNR